MLDDLMSDYQEFIDEKINDTNTILDSIKELLGGNDGIIATLKSLDSSLTNTTKDQIDSSTTNGGDGGQGAKDYVNNTVTNDRNTINSSHKIVKERIEGGANEKAVLRLFINCPFVCINFDFFWLNKARQLYMDF